MPSKQREIVKRYGKPLGEVLTELYQVYGSQSGIARALGVSQGMVSLWFKQEGIAVETRRNVVSKEARV